MSDYISRSEVWKAFISRVDSICDLGDVREILDSIPTAEPKVGNWIEKDGMWCDDPTFRCSVCGEEYELLKGTPIDVGMNYCPNCGAKMEESR